MPSYYEIINRKIIFPKMGVHFFQKLLPQQYYGNKFKNTKKRFIDKKLKREFFQQFKLLFILSQKTKLHRLVPL